MILGWCLIRNLVISVLLLGINSVSAESIGPLKIQYTISLGNQFVITISRSGTLFFESAAPSTCKIVGSNRYGVLGLVNGNKHTDFRCGTNRGVINVANDVRTVFDGNNLSIAVLGVIENQVGSGLPTYRYQTNMNIFLNGKTCSGTYEDSNSYGTNGKYEITNCSVIR